MSVIVTTTAGNTHAISTASKWTVDPHGHLQVFGDGGTKASFAATCWVSAISVPGDDTVAG